MLIKRSIPHLNARRTNIEINLVTSSSLLASNPKYSVYKGRTVDEFLKYRQDADPQGDGYFNRTVAEVIRWLDDLATERCDVRIINALDGYPTN